MALAVIGPAGLRALEDRLHDAAVLRALERVGSVAEPIVPALLRAFKAAEFRESTGRALAAIGPRGVAALEQALGDGEVEVRVAALERLRWEAKPINFNVSSPQPVTVITSNLDLAIDHVRIYEVGP